jgi:hypothetical protein
MSGVVPETDWTTSTNDDDRKIYADNDSTSLGTQAKPDIFQLTVEKRAVALYMLKIVRELSTFLFYMTKGRWTGVENLTLFQTSASGVAYSWPVGSVNLPPHSHWDRDTIIHENSHQIMWKEVNYGTLGIAYEFIFGNLVAYHNLNLLSNTEHALIEGWAEFIAIIFTKDPIPFSTVENKEETRELTDLPHNLGESVEGTFAGGLWEIFKNHVVTSRITTNAHIPESQDGDVSKTASWIRNPDVQDRFVSMIWEPLCDLRPSNNPISTDMLRNIGVRNPTVWHELRVDLQRFNMAMKPPTISTVTPTAGAATGGQTITITGTDFVAGMRVTIGGELATTNLNISSSTLLTVDTPPRIAGVVDIIVISVSGTVTLPSSYTYE